jgi:hypothetical protein
MNGLNEIEKIEKGREEGKEWGKREIIQQINENREGDWELSPRGIVVCIVAGIVILLGFLATIMQ